MNAARGDELIAFDNSYARLPERFFSRLSPEPVKAPGMVRYNSPLAAELGLDTRQFDEHELAAIFAGNRILPKAEPLAMAYAGHQFGSWVPQLGDGRAILLGEVIDQSGRRRDIQLKGSGRTPYSRMGDGRAALGPVLREYIVSEAMHALGVPTTRSLAAVTTGDVVVREDLLPGAILTRVAASHVRVGTFQYFAARKDNDALRLLADHIIERCYPECQGTTEPYAALFDAVIRRQASLVAHWLAVGFIHGVMNTDNMALSGETIDFGPCAFMDNYHPLRVYSSIDAAGRYAFARQPDIAHWNLACLARAMLPLFADSEELAVERAQASLDRYPDRFAKAWEARFTAKIGIENPREGDVQLVHELLRLMAEHDADYTLTFRALGDAETDATKLSDRFANRSPIASWHKTWLERLSNEPGNSESRRLLMLGANPAFIPRNHRIEEAIDAAYRGDLAPFERLVSVLERPYVDQPEHADLQLPPEPHEVVQQTFCGT